MNRDKEEKEIVLPELIELPYCSRSPPRRSCRTASEATVWQLRQTPCQAVTWQTDKSIFVWNLPASEISKHFHPALVRWSTKPYLCSDWRGMGKWAVILKCAPSYVAGGAETDSLIWQLWAGYIQKCISHSKKHVQRYLKVCMRVAAPETQNNTPNLRKSIVFIFMSPLKCSSAFRVQNDCTD